MLRLATLLFATKLMARQEVAIEGTVIAADTNVPIAGAKVILRYMISAAPLDTSLTGAPGNFHVAAKRPETYFLEASAPGFQETVWRGPNGTGLDLRESEFESRATPTLHTIDIKLSRAAVITGRIRDAETEETLSLITVRALRFFWLRGKRQLIEERIAFTNKNGDFRLEDLPSGDYVLELRDNTPQNRDSAVEKHLLTVLPEFTVPAGGMFDSGTLNYLKAKPPMIRGTVARHCSGGEKTDVSIRQIVGGASIAREKIPVECEVPFPIPIPGPGNYQIHSLIHGSTGFLAGSAEIDVAEGEDSDMQLHPVQTSVITGHIACQCEKPLETGAVRRMTVGINPMNGLGLAQSLIVNQDGAFAGPAIGEGLAHIDFGGVPPGTFVESILVNGAVGGRLLDISRGVAILLEIVLSDQPASLSGTAAAHHVLLSPWPPRLVDGYYSALQTALTDSTGRFSIQPLAAGTYRIATVDDEAWALKEMPDTLPAVFAHALEITLQEKENRIVSIGSKGK